jgi:NADH:ubiquinone oxidoreductase subunit 2 (subunit N)
VYYVKVLKVMFLDRPAGPPDRLTDEPLPEPAGPAFYGTLLAILLLILGIAWNPLIERSDRAVEGFRRWGADARSTMEARL